MNNETNIIQLRPRRTLLPREKKDLLRRISNAVGDELLGLREAGWSLENIEDTLGISTARASELINKKGRTISDWNLFRAFQGGLITVEKLETVAKNHREKEYLQQYKTWEIKLFKELGRLNRELEKHGENAVDVLRARVDALNSSKK